MKKIRVLILITVMDRAGAETVMMNYLRNIDTNLIQMDFLINKPGKPDYYDEIIALGSNVFHMCPISPFKFGKYKKEFKEFLKNNPQYDVIHSHLEERSYLALKVAKKMGVKVRIAHAHSIPKDKGPKMWVRRYFRRRLKGYCTHRMACSDGPAKWLFGKKADVIIMNNAIASEDFAFDNAVRNHIREEYGAMEKLIVGHIGRMVPEKNQLKLIDIFAEATELKSNSELWLVGGSDLEREVYYKGLVEEKVRDLGLWDKVRFFGVRDDVNRLMSAMDVLVMPSVSEGFPVTLLEAQANGLPIVASANIAKETNITKTIKFCELKEEQGEWISNILDLSRKDAVGYVSLHNIEKIKDAGFDINSEAVKLQEFYMKISN